jgi:hypothetical protein
MQNALSYRKFLWLGVFAVAMGILEAIVVVYLRELYYPSGFDFPLTPIPEKILLTEMLREACTIIMLVAIAAVAGKNFYMRFSYFLFIFGMWDIFYYIGLKLLLDWPASVFTWDILFLIPVAWTGPVLAPVISALTMVFLSLLIFYLLKNYHTVKIGLKAWSFLLLGAFVIFCTFIWDYSRIIIEGGFLPKFFELAVNQDFQRVISGYTPAEYNWQFFALGEALIISAFVLIFKASRGLKSKT